MFQEILFGQTRNPSKIFPNIFINIGDMGAEIIWRPLSARRRFMTKIFPHPLVYTLTIHLIHPCTITLRYVDTQTHKSTKCGCKALPCALICTTCKIWTYTVDVCVQTYDMQNVNGYISTKWGRGDTLQPSMEERRTAAGFTTPHISKGPLLKSVHCYVFTTDHISKAPTTLTMLWANFFGQNFADEV